MTGPSGPDEAVPENQLRADLWREGTEHADLKVDLPLAERIGILVGLGRKAQAGTRR